MFLAYPYHSFDYVIDLLKTAALDPHVTKIKICLYRVARDSRVIDALVKRCAQRQTSTGSGGACRPL